MMYNEQYKEHFKTTDEANKDLYEKLSAEHIDFEIIKQLLADNSRAYFCSKLFSHSSILKAIQIEPMFYYNYFEPTAEMTATLKEHHPEVYEKMSKPPILIDISDDDLPF